MRIEGKTISTAKSPEEIFEFLTCPDNYEQLMPDSIQKFEVTGENTFLFALKGMPEIHLSIKEKMPHERIVLGAGGGKIDFTLTGNIAAADNGAEVQLVFEGDFNPMMAMMIKSPITKFVEQLSTGIERL